MSHIVRLNVGGTPFLVNANTLQQSEFFSILLNREEMQTRTENGEIFINEDPEDFRLILRVLRHPEIPVKQENLDIIEPLLEYFQIPMELNILSEDKRELYTYCLSHRFQTERFVNCLLPGKNIQIHEFHINMKSSSIIIWEFKIEQTMYRSGAIELLFKRIGNIYYAKPVLRDQLSNGTKQYSIALHEPDQTDPYIINTYDCEIAISYYEI